MYVYDAMKDYNYPFFTCLTNVHAKQFTIRYIYVCIFIKNNNTGISSLKKKKKTTQTDNQSQMSQK